MDATSEGSTASAGRTRPDVSEPAEPSGRAEPDGFEREDVTFPSGETLCAAWLYTPRPGSPVPRASGAPRAPGAEAPAGALPVKGPAVVLAHGLGGVKEMRLDGYAARLASAGYTVVVFDYRNFGASGGQPRQLLDIGRQLEDWASALRFTRLLPQVDPARVAIFGTSLSGGHVIVTAARDERVAAAIAQCPFTSGLASRRAVDLIGTLRLLPYVVRDEWARLRHRAPVMVPLAGPPRSAALMNTVDALPGFRALRPPGGREVPNEAAARVAPRLLRYRPAKYAAKVHCPILFSICDVDSVTPPQRARRHAARAPRAEVRRYPIGHFDIYLGSAFGQAVSDQLAFLQRHLPVTRPAERLPPVSAS